MQAQKFREKSQIAEKEYKDTGICGARASYGANRIAAVVYFIGLSALPLVDRLTPYVSRDSQHIVC